MSDSGGYVCPALYHAHLPQRAFTDIQETFTRTFMEVGLIFTAISHAPPKMNSITGQRRCQMVRLLIYIQGHRVA